MNEVVTQLISIAGSAFVTLLAAWAKNYFERRKADAVEQKSTAD